MEYAKSEYNKYKNRILSQPSEIEKHYLESLKELESYDK